VGCMRAAVFVYAHDNVFQDVKQEASQLAVRKRDKEGNSEDLEGTAYFDLLVFDEAYLVKFRELFFDAQAGIIRVASAYLKEAPAHTEYLEDQDFSKNRDFTLTLAMPDDFNFHMTKPVQIEIRQYLIAYIMYRWLETKLPEEAGVYLERSLHVAEEVKKLLDQRTGTERLWHGYW